MSLPTLTEYFDSHFLKFWIGGKQLSPLTKKSYLDTMRYWSTLTKNQPLDLITDLDIAEFIDGLRKLKGKRQEHVKISTIRKHCTNLDTVLKTVGPRSRSNRKGQGLLQHDPPYVEMPSAERHVTIEVFTLEELRIMYEHAGAARRPVYEGVTPEKYWQAVIVFDYFTGLRRKPLFGFTIAMLAGQWLTIPPELGKQKKGQRVYVRREAIEHIQLFLSAEMEIVFYFPRSQQQHYLYDEFHRIQKAAGMPKERQFGFHAIRRTHNTILFNLKKQDRDQLKIAQHSSGHTDSRVTAEHYILHDAQELAVADAIDQMPLPYRPRLETKPEPPATKVDPVGPSLPKPVSVDHTPEVNPKPEPQPRREPSHTWAADWD